jgi:hypothetical protein
MRLARAKSAAAAVAADVTAAAGVTRRLLWIFVAEFAQNADNANLAVRLREQQKVKAALELARRSPGPFLYRAGRKTVMAQKHRFHHNNKRRAGGSAPSDTRTLRRPPTVTERAPAVVYGKPFILMEDEAKNTFIYEAGNWVPHSASIAECRQTCQVKELSQRVNGRIRYEIRCPQA